MKLIVWLVTIFTKFCFKIIFHNLEKFPMNGKAIICPNHLSSWDPIVLYLFSPRHIRFLAKKELFKNKFLSKILLSQGAIPVEREKPGLKMFRECMDVLNNNNLLGLFPQGTRMSELKEEDVKSGVSLIAFKTNSPVVPIFIKANYKFRSTVHIYIGDKIEPYCDKTLTQKENYDLWSRDIVKKIKELEIESKNC